MNIDKVREYCLSKPGAVEDTIFKIKIPVFKVGDKMFGIINIHDPERTMINLKYPKEEIYDLRSIFDEIKPGYGMNIEHWNYVYLDGELDEDFIKKLIDISYELVFKSLTKKKQKEIKGCA